LTRLGEQEDHRWKRGARGMKTLMNKNVKQQSIEKVFLGPGEEWVGVYKRLRTDPDGIGVILQLTNGKSVDILLPIGLEEETIQKEFCSIKMGDKISLLHILHTNTPILIRKLQDGKNNNSQNLEDRKRTD